MGAGMPVLASSPLGDMPGATIDTLIGSSMHQPSSRSANPCHSAPGSSSQAEEVVANVSGSALWNGTVLPLFGSATVVGCQQSKNQPPALAESAAMEATFWRKAIASEMHSPVSFSPSLSIMAEATSQEARMA